MIALRYFISNKREKFISVVSVISFLGITLGVATLIIVMSVMNGFHVELVRNIVGINGDIYVYNRNIDKKITNYNNIHNMLLSNNCIESVTPTILENTFVIGNRANTGAVIRGLDIENIANKKVILSNVTAGSFSNYTGNDSVAVGIGLARLLGVSVGSHIKLLVPKAISTVFGSMPRAKNFEVVAVFSSGLYEYDSQTILMPLNAVRQLFSFDREYINLLEIKIYDSEYAPEISRILSNKLNMLGLNLYLTDWTKEHKQFLDALDLERTTMFFILMLIILIASFNISSILFMIVKDKIRDIAMLRKIGASNTQIILIFIFNGMLVSIIGILFGIILGCLFSYNIQNIKSLLEYVAGIKIFEPAIYFLYRLPSVLRIKDVATIASSTAILSFVASIYPAYRAVKLRPIDLVRYE
ncbi:lipoprotein-releasing ABC transporter permease subunit [Rickettsia endosymbiont of Cardiosporidium cionae]|uniref:lipoprotein-releasing ABC transporter permease subunit n=1 Tax=Rickettsia endosymbiont of Cardiosporidium cionae TaxID=2777155 RepID=UPI001E311508|nr:lipoprotein-releasing ABC transporter permease subunit [Rickettsia endosymbiont of Cardiosporidium cionae]